MLSLPRKISGRSEAPLSFTTEISRRDTEHLEPVWQALHRRHSGFGPAAVAAPAWLTSDYCLLTTAVRIRFWIGSRDDCNRMIRE